MAQFSVNALRFDPYKNFKFRVKWDGRYVAGVMEPLASRVAGMPSSASFHARSTTRSSSDSAASALTIAGAYVAGGFIPLAPYMALGSPPAALAVSAIVTLDTTDGFTFAANPTTSPTESPSHARASSTGSARPPRSTRGSRSA